MQAEDHVPVAVAGLLPRDPETWEVRPEAGELVLVLVAADLAGAASQLALAGLVLTGHPALWEFMALLAVTGCGQALFGPAMIGMIPQLAAGERLQQANATVGLAASIGAVAGPAVAGIVVAATSPGWAILANGFTYLVSAACMAGLPVPRTGQPGSESFLSQMRAGWQEFRSRSWLWGTTVYNALANVMTYAPFMVIGAVIAKADLGGVGAWAAILAAQGAGAMLGGLASLAIRPARPLLAAICGRLTMFAPLVLLVFRAPVPVIAASACLSGLGLEVFDTLWDTTLQRGVPAAVLSRVSAYDWLGAVGLYPVGYALIGPLTGHLGTSGVLWLSAASLVVITTMVLAIPSVRTLRGQVEPEGAGVSQ